MGFIHAASRAYTLARSADSEPRLIYIIIGLYVTWQCHL